MKDKHILVFGDAMLDSYVHGSVKKISFEAPIPIVSKSAIEYRPGGAANVAYGIAALGCDVDVVFVLGYDKEAATLIKILRKKGIGCDYIFRDNKQKSIVKERVIGNDHQIVRIDYHDHYNITQKRMKLITEQILSIIKKYDIVVISDYGKGTCEPELCRDIIRNCIDANVAVIVDPNGDNWGKYKGASIIKPNLDEINKYTGINIPNENILIERHYRNLYRSLGVKYLLITRSEKGMTLFGDNDNLHIKTQLHNVYDTTGAGDTVLATLAVTLENNLVNIREAIYIANLAAGIVVGKFGTSVVTKSEISHELRKLSKHTAIDKKIYYSNKYDKLMQIIRIWKTAGDCIVTTNGCFDIIHRGHIELLNKAKSFGDILIVLVNSDASVRRLKGNKRPYNSDVDRAYIIASMSVVDVVVIFDPIDSFSGIPSDDLALLDMNARNIAREAPMGIMRMIRPDVHIKGGDYSYDDVPEAIYASQYIAIPFSDGYSTTTLIKRINEV